PDSSTSARPASYPQLMPYIGNTPLATKNPAPTRKNTPLNYEGRKLPLGRFADDEIPLAASDVPLAKTFFSAWAEELRGGFDHPPPTLRKQP
ncbi:MAG TPA: hypothetical protein VFC57_06635, partial [Aeromicrobium sp.]|nr:hypothetical protein [Aeromicrobium sp.]